MHDEFLNQRHGTFFFIAILDGIFFCSYGTNLKRLSTVVLWHDYSNTATAGMSLIELVLVIYYFFFASFI
jgi:hypothetical protein